jgi:hypothetical protein
MSLLELSLKTSKCVFFSSLVPQSCHHLHKIAKATLAKHLEGKQYKPIREYTHKLRGLYIRFHDRITYAVIDYGRVLSCC